MLTIESSSEVDVLASPRTRAIASLTESRWPLLRAKARKQMRSSRLQAKTGPSLRHARKGFHLAQRGFGLELDRNARREIGDLANETHGLGSQRVAEPDNKVGVRITHRIHADGANVEASLRLRFHAQALIGIAAQTRIDGL